MIKIFIYNEYKINNKQKLAINQKKIKQKKQLPKMRITGAERLLEFSRPNE